MKAQPFCKRIGFALQGLIVALRRERSMRFHLAAVVCVFGVLILTRPAAAWWAIGALTVGCVLVAELFNSAIEALADHLHPERHPEIGAVKDMAAAAVLVASLVAVAVAVAFLLR